jgi:deazaflavin-dependent oxidoreductase (nitroreductase family)
MPNIRWLIRLISVVHRWLYRLTGGILGSGILKHFLLLSHTGRKSGRVYETPLLCLPDGGRFIVVGSNGGDPRPPSWWLNLQAEPRTRIRYRTRRLEVTAREAQGEERERLWQRCLEYYPKFARYRETAGREIPVVVLEPFSPPAAEIAAA